MLEQKNNSGDRKLGSQGFEKRAIDIRLMNVLEAGRDSQQDLNGIFVGTNFAMTAVKPSSQGENNDDESIAQNTNKEEEAS